MIRIFETINDLKLHDFSSEPEVLKINTLGHTVKGVGAAEYIRIDSTGDARGDDAEFRSLDGVLWKLVSFPVRPEHFGALPKGVGVTSLDIPAINTHGINSFLIYVSEVDVGTAAFTGMFDINGEIFLGRDRSGELLNKVATTHIIGSPTLSYKGNDYVDTIFTIYGFSFSKWDGIISVKGKGGTWEQRKCGFCIKISNCSRTVFGGFIGSKAKAYGLLCSSRLFQGRNGNTSQMNLGDCRFTRCGSGNHEDSAGFYFISNWTHTGDPRTVNPRYGPRKFTLITTDELPPEELLEQARKRPYVVMSNGDLHYVVRDTINRSTNQFIIKPSIDPTLTDTTMKWIFGGGIALTGDDAGNCKFSGVDVTNCAIGLDVLTFYGPVVDRLVNHYCFVALIANKETTMGAIVHSLYCEGNHAALISPSGKIAITGVQEVDMIKNIRYLGRGDSSGIAFNENGLPRLTFVRGESAEFASHEKKNNNRTEKYSRIDFVINNKYISQIYRHNQPKIQLDINLKWHKAFGFDSGQLTIIGTSAPDFAPTEVEFSTKKDSTTINGGDSTWVSTGFSGPAVFFIYYDVENDNFEVALKP
ncbi:MAG: hypothetical protein Aureis2KO_01640 [Aureisphaera sp.]